MAGCVRDIEVITAMMTCRADGRSRPRSGRAAPMSSRAVGDGPAGAPPDRAAVELGERDHAAALPGALLLDEGGEAALGVGLDRVAPERSREVSVTSAWPTRYGPPRTQRGGGGRGRRRRPGLPDLAPPPVKSLAYPANALVLASRGPTAFSVDGAGMRRRRVDQRGQLLGRGPQVGQGVGGGLAVSGGQPGDHGVDGDGRAIHVDHTTAQTAYPHVKRTRKISGWPPGRAPGGEAGPPGRAPGSRRGVRGGGTARAGVR